MKLSCDLCGHILTEIDNDHAICDQCGMEYGAERLQELRREMPPEAPVIPVMDTPPVRPTPVPPKAPVAPASDPTAEAKQPKQEKNSGVGIWFWLIVGLLDLIVGTHGIVAVMCLIIIWIISRSSKKK